MARVVRRAQTFDLIAICYQPPRTTPNKLNPSNRQSPRQPYMAKPPKSSFLDASTEAHYSE
ncbi:hypothetical protein DFAR_330025 [Desulfarculales bacterium]